MTPFVLKQHPGNNPPPPSPPSPPPRPPLWPRRPSSHSRPVQAMVESSVYSSVLAAHLAAKALKEELRGGTKLLQTTWVWLMMKALMLRRFWPLVPFAKVPFWCRSHILLTFHTIRFLFIFALLHPLFFPLHGPKKQASGCLHRRPPQGEVANRSNICHMGLRATVARPVA